MWKITINRVIELCPSRVHLLAFLLVHLLGALLCFVPLFNLVGYESAAFFGVVLGLLATGLTVYSVRSGLVEAPLSRERRRSPTLDFGRLMLLHLAMIPGPFLILAANSLRVPNCDWIAGVGFWGLIPLGAVVLGQTGAWAATAVLGARGVAPWAAAFGLPFLDGAALAIHLATEPPIIGHQWFLGYFGGSIYDEALAIPLSLVVYRGLHLLAVISVVAALEATFRLRRGNLAGWTAALALMTAAAFSVGFAHRGEFGISIDRAHIEAELGAMAESEHFEIYYADNRENRERLQELIDDHEFRYHQLREFFGTDPVAEEGRKIRSFVYGNRESKGRLMGGRDTMVAKIWLQEIHILWRGTGDTLLAHELAHVFTGPFGRGPLKLSMQRGIGVNMGLVEGIASAAEWPSHELTPHESTAAMRRLGLAPDLRRILGAGGFWTQASGRAYTAMGSFVRYLVDREGIETFKKAYGEGDFRSAYGVDVDALIADWEVFLDKFELGERQKELARYRFDRPSIFGKECARARAELRRRARNNLARGALGQAERDYWAIVIDDPGDMGSLRELARIMGEKNHHQEALELIEARPRELLSRVQEAHFLALKGDLLWQKGDGVGAARVYEEALELGGPLDQERGLLIKSRLARREDDRARTYLVEQPRALEAMHLLMVWLKEMEGSEEEALVHYLLGRRLLQARLYEEAIPHLEAAAGKMNAEALDGEAKWMLGQSYFFDGRNEKAEEVFEELIRSEITRYREGAGEWLARVDWARRNRP